MTMIVRRDVRFALPPDRINDWHEAGVSTTAFMNAMSLLFPAGERFFMDAVRHYRDEIVDPELKQQVAGFIGQEAMHTREHIEYNDLLEATGMPAHQLDQWLWKFLGAVRKFSGPKTALAITIALEHYTAIFAGTVLNDPEGMVGGEAGYRQMWTWHSFEEAEHKAVSFDVWNAVMPPTPGNYLWRIITMIGVSAVFWSVVVYFNRELRGAYRRNIGKIGIADRVRFLNRLVGPRRGLLPQVWSQFFEYFKPGFHPCDQDIRADQGKLALLLDKITQANLGYAPKALPRRVPLHPQAKALA
jgi:uncharacterized protein